MTTLRPVVLTIDIPGLRKHISGKVREVFDLGNTLLIVATDRISAFDVILPTGIPDKGRVLTQISSFWFDRLGDLIPAHVISTELSVIAHAVTGAGGALTDDLRAALDGRSMLVAKADALPVECVARGYISGSLWKEYRPFPAHGGEVTIHGVRLPVGLRESDQLPEPIFTPATKAHSGHDENVSVEQVEETLGSDLTRGLHDITLSLYARAAAEARERGLIIADTKFEFGLRDGRLIWIDEALTPDSSRFWDARLYRPGRPQDSFDKQYVRDYLETLDWPKTYPGPELPQDVVERTAEKYREAYRRVTGSELPD
jgi:phosphoribosylaminoimidazole-succinocarboxamide synthase